MVYSESSIVSLFGKAITKSDTKTLDKYIERYENSIKDLTKARNDYEKKLAIKKAKANNGSFIRKLGFVADMLGPDLIYTLLNSHVADEKTFKLTLSTHKEILNMLKNEKNKRLKNNKKVKEGAYMKSEKSVYQRFLEGEFDNKKCHYASCGLLDAEDKIKGMAQSMELDPDKDYEDFFTYPEFNKAVSEHLDITDKATREGVIGLSEAGQEAVLTRLTSKLYDNIVKKANDIDYGDIPDTKGDVTKLPNYDKLRETIGLLHDIVKEYRQDPAPIDVLSTALGNIESRKTLFERAYRYDIELPMLMYNNTVLSIITGVSYMIAVCIEFIKSPKDDTFNTVLDTVAYKKTKEHLIYNSLKKFNKSCASGEFDKSMEYLIDKKSKKLTGTIAAAVTVGAIASIALILNIIPILREMVFFAYYTRTRVSDYFDLQADLLQMNAYNMEHNDTRDPDERKNIAEKQMKVSNFFRSMAKKISVVGKQSEAKAVNDTSKESKKLKLDELDSEESISALF